MIDLHEVIDPQQGYIYTDNNGIIFYPTEDLRGANNKFWLIEQTPENIDKTEFLFKYPYRKNTDNSEGQINFCECYGEVLMSSIYNALEIPHTPYLLANLYTADNQSTIGCICPSYKTRGYDTEFSGFSITQQYINHYSDNFRGQVPTVQQNTVYEYANQLYQLYYPKLSMKTIDSIKDKLIVLALLDYASCQVDRHWYNVGFISKSTDGVKSLKVIEPYDNGSCFLLKNNFSNILAQIEQIEHSRKPKSVVETLLSSKARSPRLGIKTSLTEQAGISAALIPCSNQNNTDICRRELAEEILTNPDLRKLFNKMKTLDFEQILQKQVPDSTIKQIPPEVITLASWVWKVRIDQLDKELLIVKRNEKDERN